MPQGSGTAEKESVDTGRRHGISITSREEAQAPRQTARKLKEAQHLRLKLGASNPPVIEGEARKGRGKRIRQ